MHNILDKKNYVLSIHISGSHFTAAVFEDVSRIPVSGSYRRVPVSHKAGVEVITGIWVECIDAITAQFNNEIIACCIAVPAAFDPDKKIMAGENYQLYPAFKQFDFESFFVSKLGISRDSIYLVSPASALLANEQYLSESLTERFNASIVIGTDVSGATSLEYFADELKWEFKMFREDYANKVLSIQWLCQRYHQLTGISILNMDQFMQIGRTSITTKMVLKEYLNNLIDFLSDELPLNQLNTIYVAGDIILAGSILKSIFLKRGITASLKFISSEQMSLLSGAVLLGYFGNGFLPAIEYKMPGDRLTI